MSTINPRLPDSLHKEVRKQAQKESVSINQLITVALSEKLSALMAEENLEGRAKRGNRKRCERAMAKVSKPGPEEYDRLPKSYLQERARRED